MKRTEVLLKAARRIASDSVIFATKDEKDLAFSAMVSAIKWVVKIDKESKRIEKSKEERRKEIEKTFLC